MAAKESLMPRKRNAPCMPRTDAILRTMPHESNVKVIDMKLYSLDGKSGYSVLFKARKDIEIFEQLRFDYTDRTAREAFPQ